MATRCSGKLKVLYLEADSGWGGSARSLYGLVSSLDRDRIEPIVAVRQDGPILDQYSAIGVQAFVAPELVKYRPSERKNWLSYLHYLWARRRLGTLSARIRSAVGGRPDLVHVNHESLAAIGDDLARALGVDWIAHCRVQLIPGWFARRLYARMISHAAHLICIAQPVRDHIEGVLGFRLQNEKTSVVHNILLRPESDPAPLEHLQVPPNGFGSCPCRTSRRSRSRPDCRRSRRTSPSRTARLRLLPLRTTGEPQRADRSGCSLL